MRLITLTLTLALGCALLSAKDTKTKTAKRLDDAASLFSEIMGAPDKSIPQDSWISPTASCWPPV